MNLHEYPKSNKRKKVKDPLLDKYNITYEDIANNFGYSNANSFNGSHRKKKVLKGIKYIISIVENSKL